MLVIATGALLIYASADFAAWGDPQAPAAVHISPRFIEKSEQETETPNIVTAVLADYRGFDTLFETTVVFAAGLACFLLLRVYGKDQGDECVFRHMSTGIIIRIKNQSLDPERAGLFERCDPLWTPHDPIIRTVCRIITPFVQLFALYVVAHGHHSPGGGFQGGVILGATFILTAIAYDLRAAQMRIRENMVRVLSAAGVLIYAGVGALCMVWDGNYLDYGSLAVFFGMRPAAARSFGILLVEIGVALAVMATMILIYYNLSSAGRHRQGL